MCGMQDVRTWEVLWNGCAGCTVYGCAYLPSAPSCLAVCGVNNRMLVFDTASKLSYSVQAQAVQPRQLLCMATAHDGTALAASGQ
jgi:hypothetical protein